MAFDYPLYRSFLSTRQLGHEFQHFDCLDSTSAYVKRVARQNLAPIAGLIVVADVQTHGYGQQGRVWDSTEERGLTFTLLLPAHGMPLVTLMVGVALVEALRALTGSEEPALKWVNDLVLRGRKLGGVLVEACHMRWMAIGVGVNLREVSEHDGIGLDLLGGPDVGQAWPRERVLAELINHLEVWHDRLLAGDAEAIRERWEAYSVTLGQDLRIEIGNREVRGRALGIDETGALRVRTEDGRIEVLTSGTVRRSDGAYC